MRGGIQKKLLFTIRKINLFARRQEDPSETNCDPGSISRVTPMNIASAIALQSIAEVDH